MRQWGSAVVVVLAASACGCSASPAAPSATLAAPTLAAGSYTLRIDPTNGQGTPTFCGTVAINGSSVAFTSTTLPVTVAMDGTVWTIRPAPDADRGLVISLRVVGAMFDGTATGRALDGQTTLTFGTQDASPEPARLSGTPVATNVVTGTLTGVMTFETPGGSAACTAYAWSLQPR